MDNWKFLTRVPNCNKFKTCMECTQSGYCLWTDYDLMRCRFRHQMDRPVSYYVNSQESCATVDRMELIEAFAGEDDFISPWVYYGGAFVLVLIVLVSVFLSLYCKYARRSTSHIP
ncbi:unnamed protein product [Allacma fusca]|uniref:Uncharacterized protein n=1 Tax=Allacma fusca TaxID=39272 RepID=A0A8J2J7I8_9HEXA|nr:unnamed protein product [Allacma fusca]